MTPPAILNALSVDVEEHFQVSAFEDVVDRASWDGRDSRVAANTDRLLDLFARHDVCATFFVLGWIAQRHPGVVRRIVEAGHEVASHGWAHRLVHRQTPGEFRDELVRSRTVLEDRAGQAVRGYRAASFSITRKSLWAIDVLAEEGFTFDSSIFPVRHDRYGIPGAPRRIVRLKTAAGAGLIEFPPSTVRLGGATLPVAGGGYLRILPLAWTRWAIGRLNRRESMPANLYLHPWEVDPEQPRIRGSLRSRLRHYTNLARTESRLDALLREFRFGTVSQVLESALGSGIDEVPIDVSGEAPVQEARTA